MDSDDFHFTCTLTYDPAESAGARYIVEFKYGIESSGVAPVELIPPANSVTLPASALNADAFDTTVSTKSI